MLQSFLFCLFGNFMKSVAFVFSGHGLAESLFEYFGNMPSNSFSFSVRVGCQDDFIGLFVFGGYISQHALLFGYYLIVRNKSLLYIYCFFALFGQIADMSYRGADDKIFPEV